MKHLKINALAIAALSVSTFAEAQVDVSLFWKKDSVQIAEIISDEAVQYRTVGHHGPAVENQYMALRLYFNDSGAIDVYSKAKKGLELAEYHWYPTKEQIEAGAGCDEYRVGKTIGLGGFSLWDGEQEVKLVATRGREARVEKSGNKAKMEMISRGVVYGTDTVDIAVTVSVSSKSRVATVEAECISGQKVIFMTGVNYHDGQILDYGNGQIAVWGIHPADVVENPLPIGGGMRYKTSTWTSPEQTPDLLRIITKKKCKKAATKVVAACSRESEINSEAIFFNFVGKM